MSTIQNLQSFDPFADATKGDDLLPAGTEDYIHIRIQQRNGRKTLTTVQGIADDYDKKKLVKAFKKKFACNGTVIEHPEYGEVIQLQGDQRKNICQFLLEVSGCFVYTLAMALSLEWLDRPCFYTVFCGMSGYSCDWNCLLLTVGATKKNVISY
ncbi:eukaryotic translation initiation factor 1b isoform X1 [Myotis myotis]|uniref:Eukaryotic translation initiation factor 1B n=1 Tax=Myotis myotis TaxID=51298 RepID=A0A7J7UC83_MYOMY|nr:eukaryotic translation initiation factor 1b isoform X1 [Myotis myotis]KAF6310376.1 eukaryotic translation initiation factor 1B [Myotis myotis]